MVALGAADGSPPSLASRDDVQRGAYPLSLFLHLYVKRRPGQPLDPFVREYLRLATALWQGTDPLVCAPMKDRDIFDLLGFD